MNIKFTKMHGLGNDVMVLDGVHQKIHLTPKQIASLAHRHTGVGFDQLLMLKASQTEGIDFNYLIFNANGQEVGQCGNGARCLALFAKQQGLTSKNTLTVKTQSTQLELKINQDQTVTVTLGVPKLQPRDIPFLAPQQEIDYTIQLNNKQNLTFHAINVGNPHAVLLVDDIQTAPVQELGQALCTHPSFPEQTNVGFMQIIDKQHIKLRVYERGCGETLACGSGAVAAAAIARLYYKLSEKIKVGLPGGDLIIHWPQFTAAITMTGPAQFVYEGQINLSS
jgi:diaminopimelate epimerase